MENIPDFEALAREALKDTPKRIAEAARNFFMQSFIKQGFTDASFIPWVRRRDALPHKTLSQSFALKNSLRIAQADLSKVMITAGEGLPYAAIHNEGGTITVKVTERMRRYFWVMFKKTKQERYKWMALTKKEHLTIHIPKRQYIGQSYTLDKKLEGIILEEIRKAERNLNFE